jgi:DNA-binding NtrC family response regulator
VLRDRGRRSLTLQVPDARMSARHAVLKRDADGWICEDLGSRNGTFVDGERIKDAPLGDSSRIVLGHTVFWFRGAIAPLEGQPADVDSGSFGFGASGLGTLVPALERDFRALDEVARARLPILVEGESGTGKEVLARAIHRLSRRAGELVAVNCGALPPNLVESELFGHVKGSFSGAVQDRPGLVRSADGGTLFLDEIGDLPLSSQPALLRVLQERTVLAVGATRPVKVDLSVIAATHRDVAAMVARQLFREDLFARLAGFRFRLPPLRERKEDLGILVASLLQRDAPATTLSPAAILQLLVYNWPRNIRELEHTLTSARVLAAGGPIEPAHLPASLTQPQSAASGTHLDQDERRTRLTALLESHRGNVSAVARELGTTRMQVHRWAKRYGLDLEKYR